MTGLDSLIAEAAALLQQANRAVALTGAGISTPSGIPDFRTPDSGVWENVVDPMEVASIYTFKRHPEAFFEWIRPLLGRIMAAQPNAAHRALAELEQNGRIHSLITQNIDLLHTRAGSRTVYEVHGHLREATCISCYQIYETESFIDDFMMTGDVPLCPACLGVLKPNVILFGEMLPARVMNRARVAAMTCDLMLVAGSSLAVAPAGDLPLVARQNGAKIIIVNLGDTHLDEIADVRIRADVVEALPRLAAAVRRDV